ncbi:dimethylsulfonioproprionate lyase family protein, partial [Tateyamaria sp.]
TLLIGPDACGHHHPDFNLGIFMLGPRTLYRDHNHDAPELYLNLSEKSGWRFGTRDWQDYPAGSLIWNAAGEPHATRVYDQPFISVFVWLENVNSPCNVIHFDDWAEVEQDLAKQPN